MDFAPQRRVRKARDRKIRKNHRARPSLPRRNRKFMGKDVLQSGLEKFLIFESKI